MEQRRPSPAEMKFYTPTTVERFSPPKNGEGKDTITNSKPMRKLLGGLLGAYSETKTTVFNNGDPLEAPRSSKDKKFFEDEVARVAVDRCQDLFDADGKVKREHSDTWVNVLDIAPQIVKTFLSSENYIKSVSKRQSANLVGFAIDVARNPELLGETALNTGFGGSDDEFSTTRVEAYTLPSVKILRELKDFYAQREAKAFKIAEHKKALDALVEQEEHLWGRELDKDEKRELNAKAADSLPEIPGDSLNDDEKADLRKKYAIAPRMPKARFFFGAQAAIAINHTMQPDGIRKRLAENTQILQDYVQEQHPDVADQTEVVHDKPWDGYSPYQKVLVEYFAHVLRESDHHSIKKTLQLMERLGGNHGGEEGAERAAEYAAIHPVIFQDRLDVPFASFLEDTSPRPKVNFTIGGKTEKQFCALRDYLTEHATTEGLQDFISKKAETADPERKTALEKMNANIDRWKNMIAAQRADYGETDANFARPDRPFQTVQLITSIGQFPTYYAREGYDQPHGNDIDQQVTQLSKPKENESKEERLQREGVLFDLVALQQL